MCELLELSLKDYKTCNALISSIGWDEFYRSICCYHMQQAIEKALKAVIDIKGVSMVYTHDIRILVDIVSDLGVQVPQNIVRLSDELTKWESSSRYSNSFKGLKQDLEDVMNSYIHLFNVVESISKTSTDNYENLIYKRLTEEDISESDVIVYINRIYSYIPPARHNFYGKTKLERVYNFLDKYFKEYYRE